MLFLTDLSQLTKAVELLDRGIDGIRFCICRAGIGLIYLCQSLHFTFFKFEFLTIYLQFYRQLSILGLLDVLKLRSKRDNTCMLSLIPIQSIKYAVIISQLC